MSDENRMRQLAARVAATKPGLGQVYAILYLADTIREASAIVAESLSDIDASITQLAVAVQTSD